MDLAEPREAIAGKMSTYVLIHGSYQGSWIWKPVAERLLAAGHAVYRPTLDGSAERRPNLRPEITLKSVGQEVASLLFYEDVQDVIFVGTSSGGMVVCEAAEQAADRIRRLVFIDALVPLPGERVSTINGRPPYDPTQLVYGVPPDQARGRVYEDLPADVQEWALARYTQAPRALVDEPVDLKEFWSRTWQVDVLRCTRSALPPQAHQQRTAAKLGGTYTELDAGHYPMLSHPNEIANYLLPLSGTNVKSA
jgi:pimeloyl-ACP methyl ester carboxylesterase